MLHQRWAVVALVALWGVVTFGSCRSGPDTPTASPASATSGVPPTTPGSGTAVPPAAEGTSPAWLGALATTTFEPTPYGRPTLGDFPTGTPVPTGPATLRYDGVYAAKIPEKPQGWYYLRFFPDGTVIDTVGYGDPYDTSSWFTIGHKHTGQGTYTLTDRLLKATTTRLDTGKTKEYTGDVQGDVIEAEMFSHATGIRWTVRFRFADVPVLDAPPTETDTP
jgi:hypothetical protein